MSDDPPRDLLDADALADLVCQRVSEEVTHLLADALRRLADTLEHRLVGATDAHPAGHEFGPDRQCAPENDMREFGVPSPEQMAWLREQIRHGA